MNPLHLGFLALEISRERIREADEHRRAFEVRPQHDDPPIGPLRRSLARVALGLSRASADVAARLDAYPAERALERRLERRTRASGS